MLFIANNKEQKEFKMGLSLWGILSEQAYGTYFPMLSKNGSAYYLTEVDERFKENAYGITPIDLEGFYITKEESKVLARMTNYYVRLQKSLKEAENKNPNNPWRTVKSIREDWVETLEAFDKWLTTCEGFELKEDEM